jgi:GlpG protein
MVKTTVVFFSDCFSFPTLFAKATKAMLEDLFQEEANRYKKYTPWVTVGIGIVCLILHIGISSEPTPLQQEAYHKWGAPSALAIRQGAIWGLITSNFLHEALWHMAFTIYMLWILGKRLEYLGKWQNFLLLVLSSSWIVAVAELSYSDVVAVGLGGVLYAVIGFIFVMSRYDVEYSGFLSKRSMIYFTAWILVCMLLTEFNVIRFSYMGLLAGLLWGALLAYFKSRLDTKLAIGIPLVIVLLTLIPVFYAPWSVSWLSAKALNLHTEQKLPQAAATYRDILRKNPGNHLAKANMRLIDISNLSKAAFGFHTNGNYFEAGKLYIRILEMDPKNAWAKEGLDQIRLAAKQTGSGNDQY